MESFEKRQRERKKQQQRKEKAARKLSGTEPAGPSEADYFADPSSVSRAPSVDDAPDDDAKTPPALEGGTGS